VLFFLSADREAIELLSDAGRKLGLPPALLDTWHAALPAADAVCLALREDRRSVRLYTQYWDRVVARFRAGADELGSLYLGFKALADGTARIDRYDPIPLAPREAFWPPMADALIRLGLDRSRLEEAFAPLSAEAAILTRTAQKGRASWLVTVRRAGLDRAKVAQAFAPLRGEARLHDLVAGLETHDLLHVAGGHDATKGAFTTLYRATDPVAALDRITDFPRGPDS
jgi:hypothetical protein